MMRATKLILFSLALLFLASAGRSQSPAPIVVDAASSASTSVTAKTTAAPAKAPESLDGAIKLLEEMQAANAALLKKQEATLQKLDELQQDAEQLKIFSKRG
jgi:cell shape-determining protein MreC